MLNGLESILRRPRTVLTVMVVLLFMGVTAYVNLPKESTPNVEVPYLYISATMTGVSPADAEQLLARPIESELRDLTGLVNISSTSTTGHASVFLEFDVNIDPGQAYSDTLERMDRVQARLPSDADNATVHEVDIAGFPTISVSVYGDVPERTLIAYAEQLQEELEGIGTVREVALSGGREEILEINVDLLKLDAYNLTTNELFDALSRNNLVVPAGALDTGQGRFNLEVPGLITTAEQVYSLPLKTVDGTTVTFSDVATITRTYEDATEFTRVNGEPALILGVTKRTGTNIIDNSNAVRAVADQVTAEWPSSVRVSYILDQAVAAEEMLVGLESSVITAIVLVMIVAVAMLSVRPALLIGLSIPVSFMTSFFILQMMGLTVNMMIMFGLVLTVGMLVDSAVVMVEYAERKIAEGMKRKEAFIRAARLMFLPILSSMATTIAAFLPLLLWPGIIGKFMSYFPIMVIVTLASSLVTSMIFIPVVGGLIARTKVSEAERQAAQALTSEGAKNFDIRQVPGLTGLYVRVLSFFVRRPLIAIILTVGSLAGIVVTYSSNPTGIVAFPEVEPEFATVAVTGRGNYSPVEVRDILVEVEDRILPVEGIGTMVMNFGSTGALGSMPPDTLGNFQLELAPWKDRRRAAEIFADIRERTADIAGVGIQVIEVESGPPAGKDINIRIEASNRAELLPTVERVRAYIENELGNAIDVEDNRPLPGIDWQITVNREQAALFGIGVRELSPYVQLITSGVTIGTYLPPDASDPIDIVVRLPQDERTFDALDSMRIATPAGLVPVSGFIDRQPVPKVANISRYNGSYTMSVQANIQSPDPQTGEQIMVADKVAELQAWIGEQEWPSSIEFVFGGAEEQTAETNAFMAQAGVGVLFLMFLILLTQFNSFYQVFVTLTTVVMSTAGVVLGMIITGQPFSAIMTGIGIVSLAGIVVNNAIILIDTFNRLRGEGVETVNAVLMTGAQRLRPIMLTTITTVAGLIPMALGINIDFFNRTLELGGLSGAWWSYLTAAIIFGLSFSTLLTLVVVPVLLVAPTVWKRQAMAAGAFIAGVSRRVLRREEPVPQGFDGMAVPVDEEGPHTKHIVTKDVELVERNENGVTILSRRPAAE